MGNDDGDPDGTKPVAQELRTLSFRMREIQRLLNARVEQENRRLEADGIEPVPTRAFEGGDESEGTAREG